MKDARDVAHTGQHIHEGEAMLGQHEVIETKRRISHRLMFNIKLDIEKNQCDVSVCNLLSLF
jgi:hypothetical protein